MHVRFWESTLPTLVGEAEEPCAIYTMGRASFSNQRTIYVAVLPEAMHKAGAVCPAATASSAG
jgi:hypothetical protein